VHGTAEAQNDVTEHLPLQPVPRCSRRIPGSRAGNIHGGLRHPLLTVPPITDANNVLTNFLPSTYVAANAPKCANATCTLITPGTGDPLNGIIVAGRNSPFGNGIYAFDKGDIQPRIGVTWNPGPTAGRIFRGSYGVYYDQALVGIFEQNSFTNPPYVNTVSLLNSRLSSPGAGTGPTTAA